MYMQTFYNNRLSLIDRGSFPQRHEQPVLEILKRLSVSGRSGKMATFLVKFYQPRLTFRILSNTNEIKLAEKKSKENKTHHLLVIKMQELVICYLLDNGRTIASKSINNNETNRHLYLQIQSFKTENLSEEETSDLLSNIDGLLFKEPIQKIEHFVALSGFGKEKEYHDLSQSLKMICQLVPLSKCSSTPPTYNSSTSVIQQQLTNTSPPDLDRLEIFIRFLVETTTALPNTILAKEKAKVFQINLEQEHITQLESIKKLFNDTQFKEVYSRYQQKTSAPTPVHFIVKILYQYASFDYQSYFEESGIYFHSYTKPTDMSTENWKELINRNNKVELEPYKNANSISSLLKQDYEELASISTPEGVTTGDLNALYSLLPQSEPENIAKYIGHCSEDAMLTYLRNNPDILDCSDIEKTIIFSCLVPDENAENTQVLIHERCNICSIHFDKSISEIINVPTTKFETYGSIPISEPSSQTTGSKSSFPEGSGVIFTIFTPYSSGVRNSMKHLLGRYDDKDKIIVKEDQLDTFADGLNHIVNSKIKYKTQLIGAAAEGNIEKVRTLLNKPKLKINAQDTENGNTALHYACMFTVGNSQDNKCAIILLLLNRSCDQSLSNKNGDSALELFELYYDKEKHISKTVTEAYDKLKLCLLSDENSLTA